MKVKNSLKRLDENFLVYSQLSTRSLHQIICDSLIKIWNKEHQIFSYEFFTNRAIILMFFVLFFHVVCEISNLNRWTAKHLAQASCTEFKYFKPKQTHYRYHLRKRINKFRKFANFLNYSDCFEETEVGNNNQSCQFG